jgi:sugar phosphate isomerase/epimerase
VVNTDEGPKPPWTTEEEDHVLMRYTLTEAAKVAEPRGILIGLEPHQQYSRHPDGLARICKLVKSDCIGINFDTGNSYLCGHDPYEWLEKVLNSLVHLHAKDISIQQSGVERGKVTGTPVGCACGDGVIDWARVARICQRAKRDIVFSVECGTIDQAERSIAHLKKVVGQVEPARPKPVIHEAQDGPIHSTQTTRGKLPSNTQV